MDVIIKAMPFLLTGVLQTLKITLIAVSLGCILGLFGGMGRLSNNRFIRGLATCYVDFIRGTPLLVQLFIIYFGLPQVVQSFKELLEVYFSLGPFSSTSHIPLLLLLWPPAASTVGLMFPRFSGQESSPSKKGRGKRLSP